MQGEDLEFEEFQTAEAIGLSFHGLDFVVGVFQGTCRDGIVVRGCRRTGAAWECGKRGRGPARFKLSPDTKTHKLAKVKTATHHINASEPNEYPALFPDDLPDVFNDSGIRGR